MAIVDVAEIKEQAQFAVMEFGQPFPGGLQSLVKLGARLDELHRLEMDSHNAEWLSDPTMRKLYACLSEPNLAREIIEHKPEAPQSFPAGEIFHTGLYNDVLEWGRNLPLRGLQVVDGKRKISIWTSNWSVEEELSQAARSAILGDGLALPIMDMGDCCVNVSLTNGRTFIGILPSNDVIRARPNRGSVQIDPNFDPAMEVVKATIEKAIKLASIQQQPRGQDWY